MGRRSGWTFCGGGRAPSHGHSGRRRPQAATGHGDPALVTKEPTCTETPVASGHHGGQHRSLGLAQVQTHGQNQKRARERKSPPTEETPAGRGPAWTSSLAAHRPLRCLGRAWASQVPASWPPGGPASGPPPPGSSAGPRRPPRGPAPPASASQSARTAWGQWLQVTAAQPAGGTSGAPGMLRGPGYQVLLRPEPVSTGQRLIHGLAEQGVRPRRGKRSQEARSPVRVPPAPPPRDGESWAPSERDDGGGEGWGPWARVSFPHRGPTGVLRPPVNQQVGTQGRGDAYPAMGHPHDHSSGPETASRGAHLRLVSCSAPFRSESWSACFLRTWVRASRTSTSLAHKRHLCLEPGARPPPPGGQEQAGQPSGWGPGQASGPFLGSRAPGL